jgi:hypothetical protein
MRTHEKRVRIQSKQKMTNEFRKKLKDFNIVRMISETDKGKEKRNLFGSIFDDEEI